MKNKIADALYQWLISLKNYTVEEQETIAYMTKVLVGESLKLIILLLIALPLDLVFEMLLATCFIALIRVQTGGYHANKDWQCLLLTLLHIAPAIAMAQWLKIQPIGYITILFTAILIILLIAPIQSPERPHYGKEKRRQLKQQALLALLIPTALLSTSNQLIYINLIYWLIVLHVTHLVLVQIGNSLGHGRSSL